jgi:hypothetical protein
MHDLLGMTFGALEVVKKTDKRSWKQIVWLCKCRCGKSVEVPTGPLVSRRTRSCGCRRIEACKKSATVHGAAANGGMAPEYRIWIEMKQRCYNPNSNRYARYGGRGIGVCARWRKSFKNFLADMGAKPAGYSIDRIDNDGNYSPGNCRWVPRSEQSRNRSNTAWVLIDGARMRLSDWSRREGIPMWRAHYLARTRNLRVT